MDKIKSSQSVGPFLIGLVALSMITIVIITTLGDPATYGASITQTARMPTPGENKTTTAGTSVTQTRAFVMTQKAVLWATELAATHTPWNTPIIPPTGISMDEQVKFSGEKLGLDVLNAWFGLVWGNSVSVYAGALLDTPDQGAIAIVIIYPYRNFI